MAGIALYADLSGQPKSLFLARLGLAGFLTIAVGALAHGWNAADKKDVP